MTFNSLLKNKNVLYVVSFLALTNVFSYLISNNVDALIYFILIGYITTYFSKNMIVVLVVPMLFTNFFMGLRFVGNVRREGMANQGAGEDAGADAAKEDKKSKASEIVVASTAPPAPSSLPTPTATVTTTPTPSSSTSSDIPSKASSKIDYSKTLEDAYDQLDKMIGTDGINKMSEETQRLAQQQQKIMKNIENMAPLLQNATKMLEGLPLDNIGKIQESLSGFMSKMGKE